MDFQSLATSRKQVQLWKKWNRLGAIQIKLHFTILIIGHLVSEAIGIFHKMLAMGFAPDDITMRCLIPCLLKAGMPKDAFRIQQAL